MDAFVGEVRVFAFNFVPRNWAACDGSQLPVGQYTALFSILGVQFGGNGSSTFALPDYRGYVPVSIGAVPGGSNNWVTGMKLGSNSVTLTQPQMPMHNHGLIVTTSTATTANASGNQLGKGQVGNRGASTTANIYSTGAVDTMLDGSSIMATGGNAAHNNQMPSLGLQICIALVGQYPVRG